MKGSVASSVAGTVFRVFVGLIFVYAGAGKVLDPAAFAAQVANYRLLPHFLVALVAVALPWAEILAGILLILGRAVRPAALVCVFLEILFVFAVGSALLRGLNIECGCFAGARSLVSIRHLAEDVLLLGVTAWVYVRG